jgi:hypothetical protein
MERINRQEIVKTYIKESAYNMAHYTHIIKEDHKDKLSALLKEGMDEVRTVKGTLEKPAYNVSLFAAPKDSNKTEIGSQAAITERKLGETARELGATLTNKNTSSFGLGSSSTENA